MDVGQTYDPTQACSIETTTLLLSVKDIGLSGLADSYSARPIGSRPLGYVAWVYNTVYTLC